MSETAQPRYSESTLESMKVWSRCTFLLLVATVGSGYFPGYAALVTVLLALTTCGLAITTLVKMAKVRFPAFSICLMVMVILWSLFLAFSAGAQLIFAEETAAYADCLQNALTLDRQQQCTAEMSDGLMQRILGQ
ncbi:hypothetical protein [Rothia nasimurium]|uniref:hypothetical protein n=1 Tax=Rothia nasimurium TaxID=85336 RepID=UPI003B9F74BD